MKKAFVNVPVASFTYKNNNIFSGGYRTFSLKSRADSTVILPSEEYSLLSAPVGISPATLNIVSTYPKSINFPSVNFLKVATYKYNPDNSISHVGKKGNETIQLLWDYNKRFVISQVSGADSNDIAFTSFETSYNGNWNVTGAARNTLAITGKQSYNLAEGSITKTGLNAAKSYVVSYWSAASSATINSTTAIPGNLKNGWRYYEHKLPASATTVTITGNVIIDELRLYPITAQMSSYTFDPVVGITSMSGPDNTITYYEYDGSGKLRFIRDADRNITKAADYFYTGFAADTAVWRLASMATRYKPCQANSAYRTYTLQYEQVDINPNSATYGSYRWYDKNVNELGPADWQNTATALRCMKNANDENTGAQEQEQKDLNPCSATYDDLRWVVTGTNTVSCPLPPPPCDGPDKMQIGSICYTGQRVNISSGYSSALGKWVCEYRYKFGPDCVPGPIYTEYLTTPPAPAPGCTPQ